MPQAIRSTDGRDTTAGQAVYLTTMPIERITVTPEAERDLRRLPSGELNIVSNILKERQPRIADPDKGILLVDTEGQLGRLIDPPERSPTIISDLAQTKESDRDHKLMIVYRPVSEDTIRLTRVRVLDEDDVQKLKLSSQSFLKK